MKIDKEEVMYIAKLAKLKFSDEDAGELAIEFEGILKHFDSLKETEQDIKDIELEEESNMELREDVVEIFEDSEKLFSNVKDIDRGYVRIPKVID